MDESYFKKFSDNARKVLLSAQYFAVDAQAPTNTGHILLAILLHKDSLAHGILTSHGLTPEKLESQLGVTRVTYVANPDPKVTLASETGDCLNRAMSIAAQFGHVGIDTEHLLLALVSDSRSRAFKLLQQFAVNPEIIRDQITNLFHELMQFDEHQKSPLEAPMLEGAEAFAHKSRKRGGSALDYFTSDLTKLAQEGKLDPVIGRAPEIGRVIQILSRRNKNNPVLIGEPGVGKTAIAEAIAQRIVASDVPANLLGKRVLALDLALLVAGTMYRGQFEERIKKVIDDVLKLDDAILFIDELHTLVGAGSAEGSLDAAQIFKPSLSKGTLRVIGATTLNEYQKHIEKDAALTRRFQTVLVEEPTTAETVLILHGLKDRYEKFHGITISSAAISAATELSARYISDRFLPDKAIDVLDETAASIKAANRHSKKTIDLTQKLSDLENRKDQAVLDEQYALAARLQKQLETVRLALEKIQTRTQKDQSLTIDKADIERTVTALTGIPVSLLNDADRTRFQNLEKQLGKHIIGQDEALSSVAKVIRRSRSGIGQTKRPIGSFIFLGPSGVGKSELAKVIARQIYGKESALVKIDMSEFMERHNTSRLIGAPAGYVGYEEGGKLTEIIRRNPHCVLLLDEIEKAHPDVFNLLLQILEDGVVTDAKGRKIDFRHCMIIMTSNIGVEELTRQAVLGFDTSNLDAEKNALRQYERAKTSVIKQLQDHFRPEFLNRIDQTIVFKPLSKEDIRKIVDIQIDELLERTGAKGLKVQVDLSARKFITEHGYDPQNGARPIRRFLQNSVEDKLADAILAGTLDNHKTAVIRHIDGELVVG